MGGWPDDANHCRSNYAHSHLICRAVSATFVCRVDRKRRDKYPKANPSQPRGAIVSSHRDFCHESFLPSIWPCLGSIQRFGQTRRVSSGHRRASGRFFPAKIRAVCHSARSYCSRRSATICWSSALSEKSLEQAKPSDSLSIRRSDHAGSIWPGREFVRIIICSS
jgi:hypothetical protein